MKENKKKTQGEKNRKKLKKYVEHFQKQLNCENLFEEILFLDYVFKRALKIVFISIVCKCRSQFGINFSLIYFKQFISL